MNITWDIYIDIFNKIHELCHVLVTIIHAQLLIHEFLGHSCHSLNKYLFSNFFLYSEFSQSGQYLENKVPTPNHLIFPVLSIIGPLNPVRLLYSLSARMHVTTNKVFIWPKPLRLLFLSFYALTYIASNQLYVQVHLLLTSTLTS